jgi:hypothetical protein
VDAETHVDALVAQQLGDPEHRVLSLCHRHVVAGLDGHVLRPARQCPLPIDVGAQVTQSRVADDGDHVGLRAQFARDADRRHHVGARRGAAEETWSDGRRQNLYIRVERLQDVPDEVRDLIVHEHVIVVAGLGLTEAEMRAGDPMGYRVPLEAMWTGTLFALAAGLMWGLVFIAPLLLPEYPARCSPSAATLPSA